MEHEDVLVQGIIDVFWIEGDSIILLDYKTDRVDSAEELILRYKLQLELYADALSKIFSNNEKKMTAKERLIYSFRLKEVISL
jgi:ATP-dependent helicase/nuclease subunit A